MASSSKKDWGSGFRLKGDPEVERWLKDPRYLLFPKADGEFPGIAGGTQSWPTGQLKLDLNAYLVAKNAGDLFRAEAQSRYPRKKPTDAQLAKLREDLEQNYLVLELNFAEPVEVIDFRETRELLGGNEFLEEMFEMGLNETKAWELMRIALFVDKWPIVTVAATGWPPDRVSCMVLNLEYAMPVVAKTIRVSITREFNVPEDLFSRPKTGPSFWARIESVGLRTWAVLAAGIGLIGLLLKALAYFLS